MTASRFPLTNGMDGAAHSTRRSIAAASHRAVSCTAAMEIHASLLQRLEQGSLDGAILPMPIEGSPQVFQQISRDPFLVCMRTADPMVRDAVVSICFQRPSSSMLYFTWKTEKFCDQRGWEFPAGLLYPIGYAEWQGTVESVASRRGNSWPRNTSSGCRVRSKPSMGHQSSPPL